MQGLYIWDTEYRGWGFFLIPPGIMSETEFPFKVQDRKTFYVLRSPICGNYYIDYKVRNIMDVQMLNINVQI